jgi:hypothetical protein
MPAPRGVWKGSGGKSASNLRDTAKTGLPDKEVSIFRVNKSFKDFQTTNFQLCCESKCFSFSKRF